MLGWVIDTVDQTIELPEHRKERLLSIFTYLSRRTSVPPQEVAPDPWRTLIHGNLDPWQSRRFQYAPTGIAESGLQ